MGKMVRFLIVAIILFVFCIGSASFAAMTAKQYFDKATIEYLTGNLGASMKDLKAALIINPKYPGAKELMRSIQREKTFNAEKEKSLAVEPTPETKPPVVPVQQDTGMPLVNLLGLLASVVILLGAVYFLVKTLQKDFEGARDDRICSSCHKKLPGNVDICPNCGAMVGLKMMAAVSGEQKLWNKKMGWKRNPFTIDIHQELFTGREKEVKEILSKITSHSGHILIYAPLGTGKTTLLRWLASRLPSREYLTVYIPRPPQQFDQFIRHIFQSLGYSYEEAAKEADLYNLDKIRKKMKKNLVLLLDEAHEFTIEIERPLRTLGDLDGVNLVMAGLPETLEKLKTEIQPLYERLVLKEPLNPMTFDEIKELIRVRIENVGGKGVHPFTQRAIEVIFELSKGNPRTVLKLCDNAVTQAIAKGEDALREDLIRPDLIS